MVCPVDAFLTGTLCRTPLGDCDLPELCDGTGPECPTDAYQPADFVCRAASCDPLARRVTLEATCNGTQADCPAAQVVDCATGCSGNGCSAAGGGGGGSGGLAGGGSSGESGAAGTGIGGVAGRGGSSGSSNGGIGGSSGVAGSGTGGSPGGTAGDASGGGGASGGQVGGAGASTPEQFSQDEGGCGCRHASRTPTRAYSLVLLALLFLVGRRRSRGEVHAARP